MTPSLFIKNETCLPFNGGVISNYTGFGVKFTGKMGNLEIMPAFKTTENVVGGFGELKYTTPELGNSNVTFESRTRYLVDSQKNNNDIIQSVTERIAAKYSTNVGDFNIYEIAGVNTKFSLDNGLNSVTPTSITGVGYNIKKNLNLYGEIEVAKGYDTVHNKWNKTSYSGYVGLKFTF